MMRKSIFFTVAILLLSLTGYSQDINPFQPDIAQDTLQIGDSTVLLSPEPAKLAGKPMVRRSTFSANSFSTLSEATSEPLVDLPALQAHWLFNGNAADSSGNSYHVTLKNNASFSTESKEGTNSLTLDGMGAFVELAGRGSGFLHDAFQQRAFALWIKATSATGIQQIIDEGGATNGMALRLNDNIIELAIRRRKSQEQISTSYPADNEWHHLVAQFNLGTIEIYLDGSLQLSKSTDITEIPNHSDLAGLGARNNDDAFGANGNSYFEGLIDDVRVYDVSLDGAQIQQLSGIKIEVPIPPANVTARAVSSTAIAINWSDESNYETGFQVERSKSAEGEFSLLYTTQANEESYFDQNLTSGTTYFYRIKSVNSAGSSIESSIASATTFAEGFPVAVAQWLFNNNNLDASGNSHEFTKIGVSYDTLVKKEGMASLYFDGTDDYVQLTSADDKNFLHDKFTRRTIGLWLNTDQYTGMGEIYEEGGSTHGIALRINNGVIEGSVRRNKDTKIINFEYPQDSFWHHITLTFDQGKLNLFLDGQLKSSVETGFSDIPKHGNGAGLGGIYGADAFGYSGAAHIQGWIDDVIIYEDVIGNNIQFAQILDQGKVLDYIELLALKDIYLATNGDNWTIQSDNNYNNDWPRTQEWDSISQLEQMRGSYGVAISNGDITQLNLSVYNRSGINLDGEIPFSIGNLTGLTHLRMNQSKLRGTIPESIGNLQNLRLLWLWSNQLEGEIPDSLYTITAMYELALYSNNLEGELKEEIGNMVNLGHLWLRNNKMSGKIPSSIGNLTRLHHLVINYNNFEGEIFQFISNMVSLRHLDLSYNNFSGNPSHNISNLNQLQLLRLTENDFSGEILEALTNMPTLRYISLGYNKFTGDLHPGIGNLKNLYNLYIHNNEFTGPIPDSYGNLSEITWFGVFDNNLTGGIPDTLRNLKKCQVLALNRSGLQDTIPEWISDFPNLWYLGLSGNEIHGTIPESYQNLTNLQWIDFEDTEISGALPEFFLNYSKLYRLNIFNTNVTSIPDFQDHPNAANLELHIHDNYLDFAQLEKLFVNAGEHSFDTLTYIPQKPLKQAAEEVNLFKCGQDTYTINFGGNFTTYQWQKKNENEWTNIDLKDSLISYDNIQVYDTGYYRCLGNNSFVKDLELTTEPFLIKINDKMDLYAIKSGNWNDTSIWSLDPTTTAPANLLLPNLETNVHINGYSVEITSDQSSKNIFLGDTDAANPTLLQVKDGTLHVNGKILLKKSDNIINYPKLNVSANGKLLVSDTGKDGCEE